jgi:hypothetical protein
MGNLDMVFSFTLKEVAIWRREACENANMWNLRQENIPQTKSPEILT